jgi:hypothetical protein
MEREERAMTEIRARASYVVSLLFVSAACSAAPSGGRVGSGPGSGSGSGSGGDGSGGLAGTAGTAGNIGIGAYGGSGGTSGPPADGGCAYASIETDLLPANILFVVDRSGSMNCNLPPLTSSTDCEANPVRATTGEQNKWEIVSAALKSSFGQLSVETSAGIAYFNNNDSCGVSSQPSVGVKLLDAAQVSALSASLDAVPAPKGGTPIIGATILAYKHLHEQAQVFGNKFVVLLTDGMESCDVDKLGVLATEIPKARSVNIRTFVIGAPGSEPARAMLSEMAWLGGTPKSAACTHGGSVPDAGDCHFDMTTTQDFGSDLAAALQAISGKALTCEFDVPEGRDGASVDFTRVNVRYTRSDGTLVDILQDPSGDCESGAQGWQYAQDNTKIVLCGDVCDEVKADTNAKVDIVLGCETATVK